MLKISPDIDRQVCAISCLSRRVLEWLVYVRNCSFITFELTRNPRFSASELSELLFVIFTTLSQLCLFNLLLHELYGILDDPLSPFLRCVLESFWILPKIN